MANITFLVGNGLDLSLGMSTSYRDFYDYVKQSGFHTSNRIYKAIHESPENWADFELSLGEYTHYIENKPEKDKKKESIKLHEELEGIREDLAVYLEKEQQAAEALIENIELTTSGFYSGLRSGQHDIIRAMVESTSKTFRFITLNYTNTLEAILSNSSTNLSNNRVRIYTPHHIHGDLLEDLTIGVSDESQLSSSLSGAEKDDLIKPNLIYSTNDGRIDTLESIIRATNVLVIFGTSLGETDKYIWRMVTEWLDSSTRNYVIIHAHDATYTDSVKRSSRLKNQYVSSVQERLLRFSGQDGDTMAELKNQVFVIHNTASLFS